MVRHWVPRWIRGPLSLLVILEAALTMVGCGGHTPAPAPKPAGLLFASNIALDGSNGVAPSLNDNVWFVKPDGSSLTPLIKLTHAGISYPTWSPDGTKIAYVSTRALDGSDGLNEIPIPNPDPAFPGPLVVANIWVMNSDGSGTRPLTRFRDGECLGPPSGGPINECETALSIQILGAGGPYPSPVFPVWSPDGTKVAFLSNQALDGSPTFLPVFPGGAANIWIANTDGSGAVPVTHSTSGVGMSLPAWSPDGSRIAFVSALPLDGHDALGPALNIWVIHPDGSGATPLTDLPARALSGFGPLPSWSPDNTKIAFSSVQALDGSKTLDSNFNSNIWTVNVNGSGLTPLTRLTVASVGSPVWSPDGTKIAFGSNRVLDGSDARGTSYNVWVINADGSHPVPVTRLMHADVTNNAFDNQQEPVWSPDSAQLAFTSPRLLDGSDANFLANSPINVWVVNVDGSGAAPLTKVTNGIASSRRPQWRPQ